LTYLQATLIGLLQGVSELFPVSSLGHSIIIPALIGGDWARNLNMTADKSPYLSFVVAVHVATAVALIGKDVQAGTADNVIKDGKATWNYNLNRAANDLKLEVVDSKGRTVYSEAPSDMKAGDHAFNWNGKDSHNAGLKPGFYTVRLRAVQEDGDRGDRDVRRDQRVGDDLPAVKTGKAVREPVDHGIEDSADHFHPSLSHSR